MLQNVNKMEVTIFILKNFPKDPMQFPTKISKKIFTARKKFEIHTETKKLQIPKAF